MTARSPSHGPTCGASELSPLGLAECGAVRGPRASTLAPEGPWRGQSATSWAHCIPACFPRCGARPGGSREVAPGVLVVGRVPVMVPSSGAALPVLPRPQGVLCRWPGLSWLPLFPVQAGLLMRPPCFQTSAPDRSASQHQTWGSADLGPGVLHPITRFCAQWPPPQGPHGESTPTQTPRRGPSLARGSTTITLPRALGRPLGRVTTASRDANFPQERKLLWRPPPETDLSEAPAPLCPCPHGKQLPFCPRA